MTGSARGQSSAERVVAGLALALFWCAFASLAVGLAIWVTDHGSQASALLLMGGMLGLLLMPLLRLFETLVSAFRQGDRLTFAATLAVLAILGALTIRDAVKLR